MTLVRRLAEHLPSRNYMNRVSAVLCQKFDLSHYAGLSLELMKTKSLHFQADDIKSTNNMESENPSVAQFRKYLRIKTVHPQPDYESALQFLASTAKDLGLLMKRVLLTSEPRREAGIITWEGTQPSLPSIMLNSHMDVVPVFADEWKYDPFLAYKDECGNIFARGTQDMKSVGIQYLEAIRKLTIKEERFPRTVHVVFVPDEEIGGPGGMESFVKSQEFENMNVAFALDEGLASPSEVFRVFNGQKVPTAFKIHCHGNTGHGSIFVENTAIEKLIKVLGAINTFRESEKQRLESDSSLTEGDVTSINVTVLEGGSQFNVVPSTITITCDVRVPPGTHPEWLRRQTNEWRAIAGHRENEDCIIFECPDVGITSTSPDDPWWQAFSSACKHSGIQINTEIFTGASDAAFLRGKGIPTLGFSPMNCTPVLLHDHNEFLNDKVFLRGIDIYANIIAAVAAVEDISTHSSP